MTATDRDRVVWPEPTGSRAQAARDAHALVRRTMVLSFDRGDVRGAISQLRRHRQDVPDCPVCSAHRGRRRRGSR